MGGEALHCNALHSEVFKHHVREAFIPDCFQAFNWLVGQENVPDQLPLQGQGGAWPGARWDLGPRWEVRILFKVTNTYRLQ